MNKLVSIFILAFVLACGGANTPVEAPSAFDATGLKLVIGVDRAKTFEVKADGELVSSQTGNPTMKFVGSALELADGSKKILSLEGTDLRGPEKSLGTIDDSGLLLGDMHIAVKDDGEVTLERGGTSHKMRMHFEGSTVGKKRPALMLVALVFALSAATNPNASLDRYYDD